MKNKRRIEIYPTNKMAELYIREFHDNNAEFVSFYDLGMKTLCYNGKYIGFRGESYSRRLDGLTFDELYVHPDCKYRGAYITQAIKNKAKIVYKV